MHQLQANLRQKGVQALRLTLAAGIVVLLDQLTKIWALGRLAPAGAAPVVVLPGCLRLEYASNTGAAFSLFYDHPAALAAMALALAVGVLAWGIFFLEPHERLAHTAAGLVFGGATGNLVDRFRYGHVVDFIVAHWGRHEWPTFNVADAAICVGVGALVMALGRSPRPAPTPAPGATGMPERERPRSQAPAPAPGAAGPAAPTPREHAPK